MFFFPVFMARAREKSDVSYYNHDRFQADSGYFCMIITLWLLFHLADDFQGLLTIIFLIFLIICLTWIGSEIIRAERTKTSPEVSRHESVLIWMADDVAVGKKKSFEPQQIVPSSKLKQSIKTTFCFFSTK